MEHPVIGWGWIGYWAPWVEPFKGLAVIENVTYLQAHNALLDVWFQTGVIGVALALIIAIVASVRSWRIAVAPTNPKMETFTPSAMLPILIIALLLIQSLTESRLLIEGNWVLFIIICCKAKTYSPPYGSLKKIKKSELQQTVK
jgi:exopolysaccharide production protein ExoQ